VNLYPCPTCDRGLTDVWKASCNRCKAAFEAEWNPLDMPHRDTLPMEPPRMLKILRWLGGNTAHKEIA
jgi:hypothetical protein